MTASGLAALYEEYGRNCDAMQLGFFAASKQVLKIVDRHGLGKVLPLYDGFQQAMQVPGFRSRQLAGVKAVVLCAGKGTRMEPLSAQTPKPMLDFLGAPVLQRILDHLGSFGVRDCYLNPGHLGDQILSHFRTAATRSVFFTHEGGHRGGGWAGSPIGSASTLARLHHRHSAFSSDYFVLCGDALTDLDMAALMQTHRHSGAEVTIAAHKVPRQDVSKYGIIAAGPQGRVTAFQEKPSLAEASSRLASTGIYVFSPRALQGIPDEPGMDIAQDLLPRILARGGRIQVHDAGFIWADIGCPSDYFHALQKGLTGRLPGTAPAGQQSAPGVWVAPGAEVSPRARILGPCYIGPNARVEAGAELQGTCVLGADCIVEGKTVLRDTVLMPGTQVAKGTWLEAQITAPDWSLSYDLAPGALHRVPAVTGVVAARPEPPARWGRLFQAG
jgi:mannose-1-phosphate guanylyltransferase